MKKMKTKKFQGETREIFQGLKLVLLRSFLASLMIFGNPGSWAVFAATTSTTSTSGSNRGSGNFGSKGSTRHAPTRPHASGGPQRRNVAPLTRVTDLRKIHLSADPTDGELAQVQAFDAPFIPTSAAPQPGENHELALAIRAGLGQSFDGTSKPEEDLSSLRSFTLSHKDSRWALSAELNRGLGLYHRGYFSGALQAFQNAWEAGQGEKQGPAKALADVALAALIRMNSRVGRVDDMKGLLAQMDGRMPIGTAARWYEQARGALSVMQNQPDKAFFCGPYALQRILAFDKSKRAHDPVIQDAKSPKTGFSLSEVWQMSQELGMGLQMAKRQPGAKMPLPAVVNWKLGHYAALLEAKNGKIHSQDPTFGNDTWLSQKALDDEASGYFLIPSGALPNGWVPVGLEEGDKVFGKGYVTEVEPQVPPCAETMARPCEDCGYMSLGGNGNSRFYNDSANVNDGGLGAYLASTPQDEGGVGDYLLPVANIDEAQVATVLTYKPLGYHPPVGPAMDMVLTYHQKTATSDSINVNEAVTFNILNSPFGDNWSFNWWGFIQYDPGDSNNAPTSFYLFPRGGGAEPFDPSGFTPFTNSQIIVTSQDSDGNPLGFSRFLPNGWVENYTNVVMKQSANQVFLTQVVDARGNQVNLGYDANNHLNSITDAQGRTTSLIYTGDQVSQIIDPFGRSADFQHDTNGLLKSSDNVLHMFVQFSYGGNNAIAGDWVSSMTTPYGTTNFDYTGTVSTKDNPIQDEELTITDPAGLREHARFVEPQAPLDGTKASDPNGALNEDLWMEFRDTFYWDHQAMSQAPFATSSARIYHWLHTPISQLSDVLECYQAPLESRVWYNYPNQTSIQWEDGITQFLPSNWARQASNGVQESGASYNSFGKMTTSIDPAGRALTYVYGNNGIDLLQMTDSNSDVLGGWTYNGQHEPLTYQDGSGSVWTYKYNGVGEPTTVQAPLGEMTFYDYDNQGNLMTVTPPQPGAAVAYTYDSFLRVATSTDTVNGTLTYTYDNADRLTEVDYPDGSKTQYAYSNLDLQKVTDRENRMTSYSYDQDRRMLSMTDPKQQMTQYGWCDCGALTSLQNPAGGSTLWKRDVEGRVVQKTMPDTGTYQYQYDPGTGLVVSVTDPNQQVKSYTYNPDDTVSSVQNSNTNTPAVNYAYDPVLPRMTQMLDGTGFSAYTYYPFGTLGGGQPKQVTRPVGTTTANITYTYDADGRVVQRSIDGTNETYGYDSNGQLTGVTNPLGAFTYSYDPNSARIVGVTYPNNQSVAMDYFDPTDQAGASGSLKDLVNLGASQAQTLSTFNYQYLAEGEVNSWAKQIGGFGGSSVTINPAYDQDSQVSAVTVANGLGGINVYGYNADGSVTQISGPSAIGQSTANFGTNGSGQATQMQANPLPVSGSTDDPSLVSVNGIGIGENGANQYQTGVAPSGGVSTSVNVVAIDETTGQVAATMTQAANTASFQFDANGNLLQDDQKAYQWDGENRLVQVAYQSPDPNGASTITMQYDGMGRRTGITELDINGNPVTTKTFVWCGNSLCQERDGSGVTVVKQFFSQGEQVSPTTPSGQAANYYFTRDHLGSIREMTDTNGNVMAQYDYDPFGNQQQLAGTKAADFGYTGFHQEPAAGLDLAKYRAYDPAKGRWLSKDPMGEASGPSLYAYVNNNPLGSADGLGLYDEKKCQELMKKLPPEKPYELDYETNIAYAKDMGQKGLGFFIQAKKEFQNYGKFDYARDYRDKSELGLLPHAQYLHRWGNVNFGLMMAAAGEGPWKTENFAGGARWLFGSDSSAGKGFPGLISPYGDIPEAHNDVVLGEELYHNCFEK